MLQKKLQRVSSKFSALNRSKNIKSRLRRDFFYPYNLIWLYIIPISPSVITATNNPNDARIRSLNFQFTLSKISALIKNLLKIKPQSSDHFSFLFAGNWNSIELCLLVYPERSEGLRLSFGNSAELFQCKHYFHFKPEF